MLDAQLNSVSGVVYLALQITYPCALVIAVVELVIPNVGIDLRIHVQV